MKKTLKRLKLECRCPFCKELNIAWGFKSTCKHFVKYSETRTGFVFHFENKNKEVAK